MIYYFWLGLATASPSDLLLFLRDSLHEHLEFDSSLLVDKLVRDAGVQAPGELVARVFGRDLANFRVVKSHENFRPQRAVMHVSSREIERAEKLGKLLNERMNKRTNEQMNI